MVRLGYALLLSLLLLLLLLLRGRVHDFPRNFKRFFFFFFFFFFNFALTINRYLNHDRFFQLFLPNAGRQRRLRLRATARLRLGLFSPKTIVDILIVILITTFTPRAPHQILHQAFHDEPIGDESFELVAKHRTSFFQLSRPPLVKPNR